MTAPTETPAALEEDAGAQLAALRGLVERQDDEITEKDEIIGTLTDRLEQVAEQLDRVKRSGADRGPRGVNPEIAEQTQSLGDGMKKLLGHFEGVELGGSLSRIEMLLGEVRDIVLTRPEPAAPAEEPAAKPKPDLLGGWDSIKSSLLGEGPAASEPAAETGDDDEPVAEAADDEPAAEAPVPRPAGFVNLPEEPPPVDPLPEDLPEPVDTDSADRDELVAAIECRDRYINALTRRVGDRRAKLTVPTNWEALSVEEELVEQVERLRDELEDAVRTSEVDLCLERARLSRERTRLDKLAETTPKPADADAAPADKSGRWKRLLGIEEG